MAKFRDFVARQLPVTKIRRGSVTGRWAQRANPASLSHHLPLHDRMRGHDDQ